MLTTEEVQQEMEELKAGGFIVTSYVHKHNDNKRYKVTIKKPRELFLTMFLGNEIFLSELNRPAFPSYHQGVKTYRDREILRLIEVLNIVCIEEEKSIFKRF